jgi:hypothetical protein
MLSNRRSSLSLRRTVFWGIFLFLLAISFMQFAVAAEKTINISGVKYLDANSNGKYDPSEQPLKGYTIYNDVDRDSQLDPSENSSRTDINGRYILNKTSVSGILREQASSGDQLQPSSPPNGYDLRDAKDGAQNLDFGNSIPTAANSAPNQLLLYLIGGFGALIILCGGIILIIALWRLNSLTKEDIKGDRKFIIQIVSGFILLVLGLCLLISLAQMSRNMINSGISSPFALVTPAVLALLVFCAILLMLYVQTKLKGEDSEIGGMRKTIAGLLVIGLIVVVLFALSGDIKNNEIITQYIQLVGIVIAFYFGSKAASDVYKGSTDAGNAQDDLKVKKVTYDSTKNQIKIEVENSKGRAFGVNTITIKKGETTLVEGPATATGSESFKKLDIFYNVVKPNEKENLKTIDKTKKYNIIIETTPIGSMTCESEIELVADNAAGGATPAGGATRAGDAD